MSRPTDTISQASTSSTSSEAKSLGLKADRLQWKEAVPTPRCLEDGGLSTTDTIDNPYVSFRSSNALELQKLIYALQSPPPSPARDSQDDQESKVPEIIQYFVKGEFQPPTTTYIVPTGEPPLHEGRSTNDIHHHASPSPRPDHQHDGQQQPHHGQSGQSDFSQFVPSESPHVEGLEAEAGKEQFTGPQEEAPPVQHDEKEHKPEPPPMQPTWDAQR